MLIAGVVFGKPAAGFGGIGGALVAGVATSRDGVAASRDGERERGAVTLSTFFEPTRNTTLVEWSIFPEVGAHMLVRRLQ